MTTQSKEEFSSDIEPVRRRLEAWRRIRHPRDRIPEPLWAAMTQLARIYGVSSVSAALRVEYYALKDRVKGAPEPPSVSTPSLPPFIELKPRPTSPPASCQVELEDRSGSKLTLRWDPGSGVDALAWAQAFWRRRA
jgi:hypothetical protein